MQTARNRVSLATELAAGVQHGQNNLDCGLSFGLNDVDRNAASVVHHSNAAVGEEGDFNVCAVAR